MTISYSGSLAKLLLRWKGSLWKAVWLETLIFLTLYYIINLNYRIWMRGDTKQNFEALVLSINQYMKGFPITFLLGFYVAAVVSRWWDQFKFISWPDETLSFVCSLVGGNDEESIKKRRSIGRWMVLTCALVWRDLSVCVRKRFPTLKHMITAGLMTEEEYELFEQVVTPAATVEIRKHAKNSNNDYLLKWSFPLHWVQRTVEDEAKKRGAGPPIVAAFLVNLNNYKNGFRQLYCYDFVCIPLVYTQVAALATYGYFAFGLLGRQLIDTNTTVKCNCNFASTILDIYVPIYAILEFLFYVGWFKVGQFLMRPFDDDDDDLELNYFLDRHLQICMATVDELYRLGFPTGQTDPLLALQKGAGPIFIPHTKMSAKQPQHPPKLHVFVNLKNAEKAEVVLNGAKQDRKKMGRPF